MNRKSLIVFIGILLLVVSVGLIAYYFLQPPRPLTIEEVLPKEPFVYVNSKDLMKIKNDFLTSTFWQKLSKIELDLLLEKSGIGPEQKGMWELFRTQFSQFSVQPLLRNLLSKEFAIAVYASDFTNYDMTNVQQIFSNIQDILSNISIVIRIPKEVQGESLISELLKDLGPHTPPRSFNYQNNKIQVVTLDNFTIEIGYCVIGDLLVLGLKEKAARSALDVVRNKAGSLGDDTFYQEIHSKFLPSAHFNAYLSLGSFFPQLLEEVSRMVGSSFNQYDENVTEQVKQVIGQIKGFKGMALSLRSDNPLLLKYDFYFDKDLMTPEMRSVYSCASSENKTLNFIPHDVLGYQWASCNNFQYLWEQFKNELEKIPPDQLQQSPVEAIANIESTIQMNIEKDILPILGDEVGGFLVDVNLSWLFPVPQLVFLIEVTDPSQAEKIIQKLTENQYFVFQPEPYADKTIHYISLPLGGDLQPAYSFVGNYLLVSTSRQLIKQCIDISSQKEKALLANPIFNDSQLRLSDKSHGVLFLKIDAVSKKVREFVDWSQKLATNQESQQKAFVKGSQKRLEEIKAEIQTRENEMKQLNKDLRDENVNLKNLQFKLKNIIPQEGAMQPAEEQVKLQDQIDQSKDKIMNWENRVKDEKQATQLAEEQIPELITIVSNFEKQKEQASIREYYIDQLIDPALQAFESLDYAGIKFIFGENVLESIFFIRSH